MRLTSLVATALTLATMIAVALPSTGCPSDDKKCSDYAPPTSFDPNTPATSFEKDVFPIFKFSCAFTSCHGTQSGSSNGVFLGGEDAKTVRTGLVDQPAPELTAMPLVKPGDPHGSYLMRKMDGSHCLLDAQCTDGSCGDSMPHNEDTLDVATRDVVRRWIAQGAPDN